MQQSVRKNLAEQQPSLYEEPISRRGRQPIFMKRAQLAFMAALVGLDLGCTGLAYFLAYRWLQGQTEVVIGPLSEFWLRPTIHAVVLITIFFVQHMYRRRRPISQLDEFFKIIVYNSFAALITVALVTLIQRDFPFRSMIFYAWGMGTLLLVIARLLHAQVQWQAQARGIGDDRVLLIGAGDVGQMILQKILHSPKLGYQVVGVVESGKPQNGQPLPGVPILGGIVDIPWVIEKYDIDEVIIGLPESSHQELVGIISLCEREKVGIRVFPDVFQIMASEIGIGDLGGLPLLTVRDVALRGWKLTLKRGVDVVLSIIGLIFLSPFLLLMTLLIKLDSPGPVFYVQERMGLDAIPFKMIKFRSMRMDAEHQGPGWTIEDDPRRTRLGGFLRNSNLDELPQLVNVLVGDMSLVGPRPERPVYVEQFRQSIPRYMDRHREKAGMTGWAQVNGLRGDTSIAERTKYDLWYIENWSLALDFKIILRQLVQWLFKRDENAY